MEKLNKKIKWIIMLVVVISLVLCSFILVNTSFAQNGDVIASNASEQLNNLNIEYIKNTNSNGETEEYWRDLKNGSDRRDTKDSKGNLISTFIVKENGKRIIFIDYENGKVEGRTWVMPDKIAQANKTSLSKSLLEGVKSELKDNRWKLDGSSQSADGTKVKKISALKDNFNEIVYVDEATGFPIKREFYQKVNGNFKLVENRTEEYKKIQDDTGKIFESSNVELKEVPAPVVGDDLGQG